MDVVRRSWQDRSSANSSAAQPARPARRRHDREDAHTITATQHRPLIDGELIDIGRVGEITAIDTGAIEALLGTAGSGHLSIARSADDGHVYNVNADTAAAALAAALGAETLMVLTDVEGLYEDWPNSDDVISRLTASELEKLLPDLSSGMVPKMEGCLHAVRNGVTTAGCSTARPALDPAGDLHRRRHRHDGRADAEHDPNAAVGGAQ